MKVPRYEVITSKPLSRHSGGPRSDLRDVRTRYLMAVSSSEESEVVIG